MEKKSIAVVFLVVVLGIYHGGIALAAESQWHKYENSHFIAYSDNSEPPVRRLLKELEYFRAAVIQFANIEVPPDTPKTHLVVFDSRREFRNLIDSERVQGFVTTSGDSPQIVVSAGVSDLATETRARREYSRVLLRHKNFPYPVWFRDGFADLMAPTTFRRKHTVFSVGEYPGRRIYSSIPVPWHEIVAEDFDALTRTNRGHVSDAYLQCWMLAYYFMLADDFSHAEEFATYLRLRAGGKASVDAMELAVGEPIAEFGEKLRRKYVNRTTKYVTYDLQKASVDLEFVRSAATEDEILPIIEMLRGKYADY